MELMKICCGMLAVSVRKMKALTVKMETVTITGNGGWNLTCFVYQAYAVNGKIFLLSRCIIFRGGLS